MKWIVSFTYMFSTTTDMFFFISQVKLPLCWKDNGLYIHNVLF